jgi:hypothetical protein
MSAKRIQIAKLVAALGEYYDKPLTATQIAAYTEDLVDLEPEALSRAILAYRRDPKNDRFPLPAKLKELACPSMDPETNAVVAADLIVSSISKYGPDRGEDARKAIGELGWAVVQNNGGWDEVCRSIRSYEELPTMRAQLRNSAKAIQIRARAGVNHAPVLQGPTGAPQIDVAKLLSEMP